MIVQSSFMAAFLGGAGVAVAALLGACALPQTATAQSAISEEQAGNICAGDMTFDVTGPYYANCKSYLLRHARADVALAGEKSQPAEHRACMRAGLAQGTDAYGRCVQEMYQLDLGSQHI